MNRVHNATAGGNISIQNENIVSIKEDTLLANVSILQYSSTGTDAIQYNNITGNLLITEGLTNSNYTYFGGNIITGNTIVNTDSSNDFLASYLTKDEFIGDLEINKNGTGNFLINLNDAPIIHGDFSMNSTDIFSPTYSIISKGGNSTLSLLNPDTIEIPKLEINKDLGTSLTINNPDSISNDLLFTTGHISADALKRLRFEDNATQTGASLNSHVIGVVEKIGNDAFTFPIGTSTSYNPVSISAPASISDAYSATYI